MRKLIIEMNPDIAIKMHQEDLLDIFESIEIIEILQFDLERGAKIVLAKVNTYPDSDIEDLESFPGSEVKVINSEGNRHLCLLIGRSISEYNPMVPDHGSDLIWTTPMSLSKEKMVYSVIGEDDKLREFIEHLKGHTEIFKVTFQKATYKEFNLLSVLTEKQREILITAKRNGYFELPKKIHIRELSEKLKMGRSTVAEHLQKAETRLMEQILAGY